jgi:hypothetical protein
VPACNTNGFQVYLLAPSRSRDHLVLYSASIQPHYLLKFDDSYGLHECPLAIEQIRLNIDPPDLILQTLMNICRPGGVDNSTWVRSGLEHKFLADNKYGRGSPDRVKRRALADVTEERGNPPADSFVIEPPAKRRKSLRHNKIHTDVN